MLSLVATNNSEVVAEVAIGQNLSGVSCNPFPPYLHVLLSRNSTT